MSRLNKIVLTAEPKGNFLEGLVITGETPKPGTLMQIVPTTALVGGRHTWRAYTEGTDGNRPIGPLAVLCEDVNQGKTITDAYAAGDRCRLYCPLPGDELNLLFMNVAGTADDVAAGVRMIPDSGTGKVIPTTGTVEVEPAVSLEAIVDPTADQLLWCMWSGF